MPLIYLDASALIKLVVRELESEALLTYLHTHTERVSSTLVRIEVFRALHRAKARRHLFDRASDLIDRIALLHLHTPIVRTASEISPAALRALDAIHLASALSIRDDLEAFVSYDQRQLRAARDADLPVASPQP